MTALRRASVADVRRPSRRREEKFFTASYSWFEATSVCLRKEGTGVNTLKPVIHHRKHTSYAVVPTWHTSSPFSCRLFIVLFHHSYRVGRAGEHACPETDDEHPRHCDNRLLLAAA